MGKNRVFVDSSVIIAALLSERGGSFALLHDFSTVFKFYTSEYGLAELNDTLATKFTQRPNLAVDLHLLLGTVPILNLTDPPLSAIRAAEKVISKKDAHILASSCKDCDFLLTLDKEFISPKVQAFATKRNCTIVTPQDLFGLIR